MIYAVSMENDYGIKVTIATDTHIPLHDIAIRVSTS